MLLPTYVSINMGAYCIVCVCSFEYDIPIIVTLVLEKKFPSLSSNCHGKPEDPISFENEID